MYDITHLDEDALDEAAGVICSGENGEGPGGAAEEGLRPCCGPRTTRIFN